jgi:F-type H+-transporting ATPase subunit b
MEGSIVAIDWTLIVQALNFLIFMILIDKFLFKPLLSLTEEREAELNGYYRETEKIRTKANKLLEEYERILNDAKNKSKQIISSAINEAKAVKEELIKSAQEEAKSKIESAKDEIWTTFEKEKEKIESEIEKIADVIVEKILGKAA